MRREKCSAAGKRALAIPPRKTATYEGHGKEARAETEEERVLGIPPVVRLRPVVVEPEAVLVALDVEHVRVAVGVGYV